MLSGGFTQAFNLSEQRERMIEHPVSGQTEIIGYGYHTNRNGATEYCTLKNILLCAA